jgi:ATP dependent DNA ligase C terminal region
MARNFAVSTEMARILVDAAIKSDMDSVGASFPPLKKLLFGNLLVRVWDEILDADKMKKCVWVRPKLVAVIEFLEWTEGDRLRHSKFVALRDDKDALEVAKEA